MSEHVILVINDKGEYWHGHTDDPDVCARLTEEVGMLEPMPQQFDMVCQQMSMMMNVGG